MATQGKYFWRPDFRAKSYADYLKFDQGLAAADAALAALEDKLLGYGEMYGTNIGQTVVIGVINTFYEVGGGISGGLNSGFTFQNSKELKCDIPGVYQVVWSISAATVSVANKECEGAVMLNGTAQVKGTAHAEVSPG